MKEQLEMEPVFKALEDYHNLPIGAHTFNPVALGGNIKRLLQI